MFNSRLITAYFKNCPHDPMNKNKTHNTKSCRPETNGPPQNSRERFIVARQDANWNVKKQF